MKPIFIAEIKTKSMFGFESSHSQYGLTELALKYGDWISVHTDPRFGGSFDDIYMLRKQTNKPILAKGFHCHDDDVKKAFDLGATYVLVVDRASRKLLNENFDRILFEFSSVESLDKISYDFLEYGKIVYNGRDLKTGSCREKSHYKEFREKCKWLCGASYIYKPSAVKDLYPKCDAFIVGSNLVGFTAALCSSKKKINYGNV